MRSREAVNIDQGNSTDEFPPDEMLRACVELTRAILGQSALAQFVIITACSECIGDVSRVTRVEKKFLMATHMASDWGREINSPNYNKFTGLGRCCDRAWLLPDRQQLLI